MRGAAGPRPGVWGRPGTKAPRSSYHDGPDDHAGGNAGVAVTVTRTVIAAASPALSSRPRHFGRRLATGTRVVERARGL